MIAGMSYHISLTLTYAHASRHEQAFNSQLNPCSRCLVTGLKESAGITYCTVALMRLADERINQATESSTLIVDCHLRRVIVESVGQTKQFGDVSSVCGKSWFFWIVSPFFRQRNEWIHNKNNNLFETYCTVCISDRLLCWMTWWKEQNEGQMYVYIYI